MCLQMRPRRGMGADRHAPCVVRVPRQQTTHGRLQWDGQPCLGAGAICGIAACSLFCKGEQARLDGGRLGMRSRELRCIRVHLALPLYFVLELTLEALLPLVGACLLLCTSTVLGLAHALFHALAQRTLMLALQSQLALRRCARIQVQTLSTLAVVCELALAFETQALALPLPLELLILALLHTIALELLHAPLTLLAQPDALAFAFLLLVLALFTLHTRTFAFFHPCDALALAIALSIMVSFAFAFAIQGIPCTRVGGPECRLTVDRLEVGTERRDAMGCCACR